MKVCFFGIYNSEYSRNRVLMSGIRENGYEITECKVNPRVYGRLRKYAELYNEYKKIKHIKFDYVIVAFPGHSVVWLARILFGNGILFDAFVSLYNSEIEDRRKYSKLNLRALYFWFIDWFSCKLSKKVFLDTDTHINYFVSKFKINKNKFVKVLVGTTNDIFYPIINSDNRKNFVVHFHGTYIPLQGIKYIVRAAKMLEGEKNIKFRIIGEGQEYEKIQNLASELKINNIEFLNKVDLKKLNGYINDSDICLGIFGDTPKTKMVIPNKIYEAMACAKPIITAKTPAVQELLTDEKNVILCNQADAKDIADSIMLLYRKDNLRNAIADGGYSIFKQYATPDVIVRNLLNRI